MSELLNHYFKLRMDKDPVIPSVNDEPGPVITISRDYGCPGKKVAEKLTNILSSTYTADWTWIDKEVLDKLSKELNLNPSVIDDLSNFTDRKLSDYIALIFSSDYYPGEKKIKNTMAEIILSFANGFNLNEFLLGFENVLPQEFLVLWLVIKKAKKLFLFVPFFQKTVSHLYSR